jgi:uncharacterized protein (TIGR03382 family)
MSPLAAFFLVSLPLLAGHARADTGSGDNQAPVADAGLGLLAYVGDTVILNGTASSDPDGDSIGFAWTQVGGPTVTLARADRAEPEFTIEEPGAYRFSLVVNDGYQDSEPDTVTVVVPQTDFAGASGGGCNTTSTVGPGSLGVLATASLLQRRRRR